MKSIRIATIAVLATVSMGAFAAKDSGDRFELGTQASVSTPSTLSRAQVQAEAVKANSEKRKSFNSDERSDFVLPNTAFAPSADGLTRDTVRAEIIKSRSTMIQIESNT